jgi:hypothetical protein
MGLLTHVKLIWMVIIINFLLLIYLTYVVVSNNQLIKQNKANIIANKQTLSHVQ